MHPEDLRRVREFLHSFAVVLCHIPLPVPPRPPENWPGKYVEVKEMYDRYNRLPSHLQEIAADGLYLCEKVLAVLSRSADMALIAQYRMMTNMSAKTGVPAEMLVPLTEQERVRAGRRLMLVSDPEADLDDPEAEEVARVQAEIEDILWSRLSAARGIGQDEVNDLHHGEGADEDGEAAGPVGVSVERPQVPRRYPRWRAAALAAAAMALVGTTWILARSIDEPDSGATRKSAALYEKRLSHPLSMDTGDVRDSSQSFDVGDVSVTVRLSRDDENSEGQLEFTVLNKGDEERTLNFNVGAGSQPAVTDPTTLQPGEAFRRAVPVRYPRKDEHDFSDISEDPRWLD